MSTPEVPPTPESPGGYSAPPPPPGTHSAPPPPGYAAPPPGYAAPPPAGYAGAPVAGAPVSESDERTWAMLGHLGGIVIGFISGLIVYLVYKDRSRYLKEQGAEALNFQITIAIAYIAAFILWGILSVVTLGLAAFLPIYALPGIAQLIWGILAGLAANKHENYRYPFSIRLVK